MEKKTHIYAFDDKLLAGKTCGDRIKEIRKKKGLTAKSVAERLGIPYSTYSNYENNNRSLTMGKLVKIANVLETDISYLMGYDDIFNLFSETQSEPQGEFQNDDKPLPFRKLKMDLQLLAEKPDPANLSNRLTTAFDSMNETGQKKAVENVEDLAKIPEYKKNPTTGRIKKS